MKEVKKRFHMKKRDFTLKKKKNFISSFYYSTLIHSKFEFIEYRMKRISF